MSSVIRSSSLPVAASAGPAQPIKQQPSPAPASVYAQASHALVGNCVSAKLRLAAGEHILPKSTTGAFTCTLSVPQDTVVKTQPIALQPKDVGGQQVVCAAPFEVALSKPIACRASWTPSQQFVWLAHIFNFFLQFFVIYVASATCDANGKATLRGGDWLSRGVLWCLQSRLSIPLNTQVPEFLQYGLVKETPAASAKDATTKAAEAQQAADMCAFLYDLTQPGLRKESEPAWGDPRQHRKVSVRIKGPTGGQPVVLQMPAALQEPFGQSRFTADKIKLTYGFQQAGQEATTGVRTTGHLEVDDATYEVKLDTTVTTSVSTVGAAGDLHLGRQSTQLAGHFAANYNEDLRQGTASWQRTHQVPPVAAAPSFIDNLAGFKTFACQAEVAPTKIVPQTITAAWDKPVTLPITLLGLPVELPREGEFELKSQGRLHEVHEKSE